MTIEQYLLSAIESDHYSKDTKEWYLLTLQDLHDRISLGRTDIATHIADLSKTNHYCEINKCVEELRIVDSILETIALSSELPDTPDELANIDEKNDCNPCPNSEPGIEPTDTLLSIHPFEIKKRDIIVLPNDALNKTLLCNSCKIELTQTKIAFERYRDGKLLRVEQMRGYRCSKCGKYFALETIIASFERVMKLEESSINPVKLDAQHHLGKPRCRYWGCDSTDIYQDGMCWDHVQHDGYTAK